MVLSVVIMLVAPKLWLVLLMMTVMMGRHKAWGRLVVQDLITDTMLRGRHLLLL